MSHTRMDQRGRITLPKAVRERLSLAGMDRAIARGARGGGRT